MSDTRAARGVETEDRLASRREPVATQAGSLERPEAPEVGEVPEVEVPEVEVLDGSDRAEADPPTGGPRPRTDRRGVLKHAGVMAAGAVAGGAALALGQASPASAAQGVFDGSPAVTGNASSGGIGVVGNGNVNDGVQGYTGGPGNSGVLGQSSSATGQGVHGKNTGAGIGVRASSTGAGNGLLAESVNGHAVDATATNTGTAVYAHSVNGIAADVRSDNGYGLSASGHLADLRIVPQLPPPPNRTELHAIGELHADTDGALWYCVAGGSPGVWRRVATADSAGALSILPGAVRIYDSRPGYPPLTGIKSPMVGGTTRLIDSAYPSVPLGATAALINLTATGTDAGGFLAAFKYGLSWPGNSSLNWDHANQNIANQVTVAVNAARFSLYCAGKADVVIDVVGYYQ